MSILYQATLSLPADMLWYACACGVDTDHSTRITIFIIDYGKQRHPLDTIRYIFECLHEINQEALVILSERVEEWTHGDLYGFNYNYYELMRGTYMLYHDFMSFLKDISDSWSSEKLSLEQIVAKCSTDTYTYERMVQELGVLAVTKGNNTSYTHFVETYDSIWERTFDFLSRFSVTLEANKRIKEVNVVAAVSRIIIAGNFSVVATYIGDIELQELKNITSDSMFFDSIKRFSRKGCGWFGYSREFRMRSYRDESRVWNSYGNVFLHELNKMALYGGGFTKDIEDEMLLAINMLQKNIDNFSKTIADMFIIACKYNDYFNRRQEGNLIRFEVG